VAISWWFGSSGLFTATAEALRAFVVVFVTAIVDIFVTVMTDIFADVNRLASRLGTGGTAAVSHHRHVVTVIIDTSFIIFLVLLSLAAPNLTGRGGNK
jgi:hypothetical protein